MESKTVAFVTLGCRLNQADTALLCDRLARMGFEIIPHDSEHSPNLIIVNSCTVTATAFKKTKQALKSMRSENPQSYIILTGCAADVDKEKLINCDDYDLLLSNESKKDIERILPRYLAYLPSVDKSPMIDEHSSHGVYKEEAHSAFPFRSRAILKIQEGCDNYCSYCIVPHARGRERSRDMDETLDDFKLFLDSGFKEIVLSGVNICNYNCRGTNLIGLLERFLALDGEFRIRLGSTEPGLILPELLSFMAKYPERICPFLHLPLQNGADSILRKMGRKYLTGEYAQFAREARRLIPNIHLGSDIIIGFPGETQKDFEESYEFIKSINFANLHIFPFSPREGTPAAGMKGRVDGAILDERLEYMKKLKENSAKEFEISLLGTKEYVLIETRRAADIWEGWSGNYVKTQIKTKEDVHRRLLKIKFLELGHDGVMKAELL